MLVTSGIPINKDVTDELYNKYKDDYNTIQSGDSLTKIADTAAGSIESIKDDLSKMLVSQSNNIPTEYRLLTLLAKKYRLEIYTLNYDLQIERSFDRLGLTQYNKYYYDDNTFSLDKTSVIKLAGDVSNYKSMLVTSDELGKINESNACKHLNDKLRNGAKIIFIGYSMKDGVLYNLFKNVTKLNGYYIGKGVDKPDKIDNHIANTAQSFFCELIRRLDVTFKVCHIKFDGNSFGGIETYLTNIVSLSSKLGNNRFKNEFYNIYSTARETVGNRKELGFPLIKGSAALTFFKAASLNEYDLFHCHDFISAYHAQMLGKPVVLTTHSLSSQDTQNRFDMFNSKNEVARLEEMYYPMIHNIVTLSSSHKKELPSFSDLHAKKLKAPYDFVKLNQIASSFDKEEAREKVGHDLKKDDFIILYIGRCDLRKGFQYVIEAFEKLKSTYPAVPFKLMLIMPGVEMKGDALTITKGSTASGSSVPEQGIIKFLTKHKDSIVSEHLDWGYHFMQENYFTDESSICDSFDRHYNKILKYYKAADIAVIPSLYEPFGYVALEALTCKCPIVANDVDGLSENLRHDGQEFATFCHIGRNTNNIYAGEKLCSCINSIIRIHENRCELDNSVMCKADLGYEYVKNEYSTEESVKELHELYMQAIINSADIPFVYNVEEEDVRIEIYEELYNIIFDYYLKDVSEMTEITRRAGYIYKDLLYLQAKMRQSANPSTDIKEPSDSMEIYSLFWGIAGKILTMKSRVKGIGLTDVRTLAETITEITRSQASMTSSVLSSAGWNNLLKMDITSLKRLYEKEHNRESILQKPSYRDYNHGPVVAHYHTYDETKKEVIWHILNNMVRVDEMDFMLGASSADEKALDIEKPQRKVHLSSYYINKFQVTRREWHIIMGSGADILSGSQDDNYCPIYNISYSDCMNFVAELNKLCSFDNSQLKFDLPTEAQWECAAKCRTDSFLYSGSDNLLEAGWFRGNTDKPRPVGLLKENRWGLFDMSGNVQEFCRDTFSSALPQGRTDPHDFSIYENDYVTRGGSAAKLAACCRITNRYDRYHKDFKCTDDSSFLGLRLTLQHKYSAL